MLHDGTDLLETVTSNIAIHKPGTNPGDPEWITPRLHVRDKPFLHGVMKRYLLDKGILQEGEVTVAAWAEAKREGRRVIGFNGLRWV